MAVDVHEWTVQRNDLAGRLPGFLSQWLPVRGAPPMQPGDLVIGTGRRAAVAMAGLRARGVQTVQILRPPLPVSQFSVVVQPVHDRAMPGVVTTRGAMNRLTPAGVAEAAARLAPSVPETGRPRLAVMVGGPSGSAKWEAADDARLVAALQAASATHDLLVTASRRTPEATVAALRALNPALFWAGGTGENPYPGLLGLAAAALVTADSVNMASEAATAGLPVHILPVTRIAPKFERFHADLASGGFTRPWSGRVETWPVAPLAEADRVAEIVIARCLGGAGRGEPE